MVCSQIHSKCLRSSILSLSSVSSDSALRGQVEEGLRCKATVSLSDSGLGWFVVVVVIFVIIPLHDLCVCTMPIHEHFHQLHTCTCIVHIFSCLFVFVLCDWKIYKTDIVLLCSLFVFSGKSVFGARKLLIKKRIFGKLSVTVKQASKFAQDNKRMIFPIGEERLESYARKICCCYCFFCYCRSDRRLPK